ncbi:MAG: hypothetical protein COB41_00595 [Proteobacteria bacterium]|nr:MAG: hypothetical protein COB41_00595 [Pseudomonadota bacterium]
MEKVPKKADIKEVENETVNLAKAHFFQLSRLLNHFKTSKSLSRKGCVRAIQFALNTNITNKKIVLRDQAEIQLAAIIAEMLGPRTIMQAELIKREQEKKEISNGKK